jgi:thioredoxin reductase (NADPH)
MHKRKIGLEVRNKMFDVFDVIIVGGGPAGLSAAISVRQRGRTVAAISNDSAQSGLFRAQEIGNYPGFPTISGSELLQKLTDHALGAGTRLIIGRVNTILPAGDTFSVGFGAGILTSESVILATGITQTSLFPGEAELLGKGVSYCATCDGMLFRGKKVCAVCLAPEAEEEAKYLESIGCEVVRLKTKKIVINGDELVTSVTADGEIIECSGVFILRQTIAPYFMLANIKTKDNHIYVQPSGETNIPGVFAAGDCVGAPYQIAKAVGQGQVAAMSALKYIDNKKRNEV